MGKKHHISFKEYYSEGYVSGSGLNLAEFKSLKQSTRNFNMISNGFVRVKHNNDEPEKSFIQAYRAVVVAKDTLEARSVFRRNLRPLTSLAGTGTTQSLTDSCWLIVAVCTFPFPVYRKAQEEEEFRVRLALLDVVNRPELYERYEIGNPRKTFDLQAIPSDDPEGQKIIEKILDENAWMMPWFLEMGEFDLDTVPHGMGAVLPPSEFPVSSYRDTVRRMKSYHKMREHLCLQEFVPEIPEPGWLLMDSRYFRPQVSLPEADMSDIEQMVDDIFDGENPILLVLGLPYFPRHMPISERKSVYERVFRNREDFRATEIEQEIMAVNGEFMTMVGVQEPSLEWIETEELYSGNVSLLAGMEGAANLDYPFRRIWIRNYRIGRIPDTEPGGFRRAQRPNPSGHRRSFTFETRSR